ncbi:hypothetical protein EJB05_31249, partial [Eragrostis curvula]
MASGAVPPLRFLALAVLACLHLVIPAASQLSQPRPREASTAWLPAVGAAGSEQQRGEEDVGRRGAHVHVHGEGEDELRVAAWRRRPASSGAPRTRSALPGHADTASATSTSAARRGRDGGWTPEWVRVFEPTSSTPSTFYFGDAIPAGVWYGFNRCPRLTKAKAAVDGDGHGTASSSDAAAQSM